MKKEYLKGASVYDPNTIKGALIIEGFLKGAYKFIWAEHNYSVGCLTNFGFIAFNRCKLEMSPEEIRNKYRPFDISRFLQKTVYTENTRGEYRYRLEGFPVG